ncbi:DUF4112 domain-containing protein [Mariniblastus fucicola]|nr:DUF4112 domain-containing protein [Mariniblastus fucicola]
MNDFHAETESRTIENPEAASGLATVKPLTGELIADGATSTSAEASELAWVETWTDFLDTKFTIPGTRIRYGADFLMGLIPGVGDALSLVFSGVLIATMARHGASTLLVVRMLINVFLDTIVGTIPILGNAFDLFYKANYRNAKLMREYYHEGKHSGSVWPLVIGVFAAISIALTLMVWLLFKIVVWVMP